MLRQIAFIYQFIIDKLILNKNFRRFISFNSFKLLVNTTFSSQDTITIRFIHIFKSDHFFYEYPTPLIMARIV